MEEKRLRLATPSDQAGVTMDWHLTFPDRFGAKGETETYLEMVTTTRKGKLFRWKLKVESGELLRLALALGEAEAG
jgi:hypothetical protein